MRRSLTNVRIDLTFKPYPETSTFLSWIDLRYSGTDGRKKTPIFIPAGQLWIGKRIVRLSWSFHINKRNSNNTLKVNLERILRTAANSSTPVWGKLKMKDFEAFGWNFVMCKRTYSSINLCMQHKIKHKTLLNLVLYEAFRTRDPLRHKLSTEHLLNREFPVFRRHFLTAILQQNTMCILLR